MRVLSVSLRDFRCYEHAEVGIGEGLTVVSGPNGAGKTNLLEALYFGCTGRSCRTNNEREVVRFGAGAARVVVNAEGEDGPHELSVGFVPGQPKRMRVDGAPVERMLDVAHRPLVILSAFLAERPTRRDWPRSSPTEPSPTWSVGSQGMAPTAMTPQPCATDMSCAHMVPKASSDLPCSRCCSPNARRSRPPGPRRR